MAADSIKNRWRGARAKSAQRKNVLGRRCRRVRRDHLPQLGCDSARGGRDYRRRHRRAGRRTCGRSVRCNGGKCRGTLNQAEKKMATVQTIKNAVTSAVSGAHYGVHKGNQVVGAARAIDSFMGAQPVRGGRVGAAIEGYHGGQRADALRQQFSRENPRSAGGPRTAGYYAYQLGRPNLVGRNDPSAGTPSQHALLNRLRRQQEQIRAARTGTRVGRFRDQSAPTAEDFVSEEDLIRRFASSPSDAQRAIERRPPDEWTQLRRARPRRRAARTAMPSEEMPTPGGQPRSLAPR